jgi:hypothetical protein
MIGAWAFNALRRLNNMKLTVTVNIGDYQSLKLESSEFYRVNDCKKELDSALATFDMARVDDFRKKVLEG